MLGPRGAAFDNDDALDDNDDEDLKNDPVSTMDMRVRVFCVACGPIALLIRPNRRTCWAS